MTLSPGSKLLSEITFYRTYAKVLPSGKKETWNQVCDRYEQFMVDTVVPVSMRDLLAESMQFVRNKQVVPSMRLLQFAGEPVKREALRAYNCSFLSVTSHQAAAELLYLAACGVGVGYSIQRRHTEQCEPVGTRPNILTYTVEDSRESWADSIPVLLSSPSVAFDYSRVRSKGTPLSTGGTASGPEPLIQCHARIREVVTKAQGRKLTPFEWHIVLTSIGDAIVSGGVRRTALIALFDRDDREMLTAKSGDWWTKYPQFARANNSAVLPRGQVSEEEFRALIQACYDSYAGEPGIHWTNDPEYGTNPCAEIALRSSQTCNLTEVNVAACTTNVEFLTAVYAATVLGTFQAQLDSFSYVNPTWRKNQQEERLLGVSLTGQAQNQYLMTPHLLHVAAENAVQVNKTLSGMLNSKPAARVTTVKPSGTTSTVLGTSAGVHGVHAPHYVRRIGVEVGNPLEVYLRQYAPDYVEDCTYDRQLSLVKLPISMPGIVRTEESALDLLNRARNIHQNWITPGHVSGPNTHNVSLTVSYKPEEQEAVANWMWGMRNDYSGISLLPFDGGSYQQAPYTTCTEEEYTRLVAAMPELDLTEVVYAQGQDDMANTSGCEGGLCEIPTPGVQ